MFQNKIPQNLKDLESFTNGELENQSLRNLVKIVILDVNGEPLSLKWLTDNFQRGINP